MDPSTRFRRHLLSMAGVLLVLSPIANTQEKLPPGEGREELRRVCTACHALSTITAQRKDLEGWTVTVNAMLDRGAQGSDEDIDKIIKFLAKNFPKDPAVPAAPLTPQSTGAIGSFDATAQASRMKTQTEARSGVIH